MSNDYRQLAHDERCQIKALLSRGDSQRAIARRRNRSPSTISREIDGRTDSQCPEKLPQNMLVCKKIMAKSKAGA